MCTIVLTYHNRWVAQVSCVKHHVRYFHHRAAKLHVAQCPHASAVSSYGLRHVITKDMYFHMLKET